MQVEPSLHGTLQPLLNRPQLPPVQSVLDELLNELAAGSVPILLALDDYHRISSLHIHTALEYFLDHQPALVHLALARLRAFLTQTCISCLSFISRFLWS